MLISSPIISAGSGSIAGVTASRNRSGLYLRARAVPTNPNSTFQQTVRGHLADLVALWTGTLTAAQRLAWTTYAENTPLFNALGAQFFATGQQMYIRANTARLQAGLPRVDDAPTTFDTGGFSNPAAVSLVASTKIFTFTIENTDAWANEDDSAMLVYLSTGQNPSVNYFKGPYNFVGKVDGDSVTPPTSPATVTGFAAYAAAQRVFWKVNVTRADGRYSAAFRGKVTAS